VVSEYTVATRRFGFRAAVSCVDDTEEAGASKLFPHWMQLLAPTKISARHFGQHNLTASGMVFPVRRGACN
jgi:hypothetical protein